MSLHITFNILDHYFPSHGMVALCDWLIETTKKVVLRFFFIVLLKNCSPLCVKVEQLTWASYLRISAVTGKLKRGTTNSPKCDFSVIMLTFSPIPAVKLNLLDHLCWHKVVSSRKEMFFSNSKYISHFQHHLAIYFHCRI